MERRSVLVVLLALSLSLSGCVSSVGDSPSAGPDSAETEWTVEVVEVVDGDTLKVRFDDGTTENVRLLGVDTPEVHTAVDPAEFEGIPENEDGKAWLRDWGHKASEFARTQVSDAEVRITTDPSADRRGSYGRLLVYVHVDDDTLNERLLRQGYARMYDSEFTERDHYESLEASARSQGAGLWGYSDGAGGETDEDGTDDGGAIGDTGLAVASVHADADGPDGDNLNDEYVVLENRGNRTLDLSGWTLRDGANHEYAFPDGFELQPGAKVTVFTGAGTDTADALYWGATSPIWNNDGDVVTVETANGTVVVEYEY